MPPLNFCEKPLLGPRVGLDTETPFNSSRCEPKCTRHRGVNVVGGGVRTAPKGPRAFEIQKGPLNDIQEIDIYLLFEISKRVGPNIW